MSQQPQLTHFSPPRPSISIEFFPPRDEAASARMLQAATELKSLNPEYVSVTYGAGGSTQQGTLTAVKQLIAEGYDVAPHLSCIGSSAEALRDVLTSFQQLGIKRIVALRGDMPSGMVDLGPFRHATDLVRFIREETGAAFNIQVAAYPEVHPQSNSPDADLTHFVAKMAAGADGAITQYFFNADAYFDFVDRSTAKGVIAPIVPGIMPITNYYQLARFSEMCGTEIPRWIRLRLLSMGDDRASIRAFGQDVVTQLCQTLLDGGAPGLHFYSMNQSEPTASIYHDLDF
ncbi:MAG: methylenetetrahydrofolate reductase [NAD(P)H] [Pigmentiphaga sp.]|nr:methylenetetrahydrofolate reductase [NAD(P)H] [Pigmentiphaga sp.]